MATQSSTKTLASEPAGILKVSYFNDHDIDRIHVGERVDGFALPHIWINGQPAHCLKGFKAEIINNDGLVYKYVKIENGELFLAVKAQKRVSLRVHYQNQEYPLKVSLKLTIEGLRRQLQRQFLLDSFVIRDTQGDLLSDEFSTLKDNEVEDSSHLFIEGIEDTLRRCDEENEGKDLVEGPLSFIFTGFNEEIKLSFCDSAPVWRTIVKGFNLSGRCEKEECPAYNDMICIFQDLGLGTFAIEKVGAIARCPMGHAELVKVTNCIFWDCEYTIEGRKTDKSNFYRSKRLVDKETVLSFAEEEKIVEWRTLKITVSDHPPTVAPAPIQDTTPPVNGQRSNYAGCNLL